METGSWIGIGIIIALVIWVVSIFNNLVSLRNRVKNGFSQIDVQLTRRHDLIPSLVEAVKGYMSHERGTLEDVVRARNAAVTGLQNAAADPSDAEAIKKLAAAEGTLNGALGRLFALAEAYPDLKANESFRHLQTRITGLENDIADRREFYNASVNANNVRIEQFPDVIVARLLGFKSARLLQFEATAVADVNLAAMF